MYQTRIISDLSIEPVTLGETKDFMEIDFNDFDSLITSLITAARQSSERFTGLSYGTKTIELTAKNVCSVQLPLGPVQSITSVKDQDNNDLEYESWGFDNPIVAIKQGVSGLLSTTSTPKSFNVVYQTGFILCPEDLKTAIKQRVETAFQYRANASNEQLFEAVNQASFIEFNYRTNPMF